MSETTLTNLLQYLYGALTPSNQRWLAAHLVEHAAVQEAEDQQSVPDVVLSLLGASRCVNDEALQRLMDFAAADPKTITLNDLAGILPAPQTSIEELRDEYIREKYGV